MVDTQLVQKMLDYLSTSRGERCTNFISLAAHFGLTGGQFLKDCMDQRLLDKMNINRAILKEKMQRRWQDAIDKPQLQISAYRLVADDDELIKLSGDSPKNKNMERKDPLLEVLQADKVWADS